MDRNAVRRWIEDLLQRPQFKGNLSELARAAGDMPIGTLHQVRTKGNAKPETLLQIGAGVGFSPAEVLEIAGWLPKGESVNHPPNWSAEAREAAQLVDEIPPDLREVALAGLRATTQSLTAPPFQQAARTYLQAAENQGPEWRARP